MTRNAARKKAMTGRFESPSPKSSNCARMRRSSSDLGRRRMTRWGVDRLEQAPSGGVHELHPLQRPAPNVKRSGTTTEAVRPVTRQPVAIDAAIRPRDAGRRPVIPSEYTPANGSEENRFPFTRGRIDAALGVRVRGRAMVAARLPRSENRW